MTHPKGIAPNCGAEREKPDGMSTRGKQSSWARGENDESAWAGLCASCSLGSPLCEGRRGSAARGCLLRPFVSPLRPEIGSGTPARDATRLRAVWRNCTELSITEDRTLQNILFSHGKTRWLLHSKSISCMWCSGSTYFSSTYCGPQGLKAFASTVCNTTWFHYLAYDLIQAGKIMNEIRWCSAE